MIPTQHEHCYIRREPNVPSASQQAIAQGWSSRRTLCYKHPSNTSFRMTNHATVSTRIIGIHQDCPTSRYGTASVTSETSASVASHRAEMELMLLTRWARKAGRRAKTSEGIDRRSVASAIRHPGAQDKCIATRLPCTTYSCFPTANTDKTHGSGLVLSQSNRRHPHPRRASKNNIHLAADTADTLTVSHKLRQLRGPSIGGQDVFLGHPVRVDIHLIRIA